MEFVSGSALCPYGALEGNESFKSKPLSLVQLLHRWRGDLETTKGPDFLDEYLSLTRTDPPMPDVPNPRVHSRRMRTEKTLLYALVPLIPAAGLVMLYNFAARPMVPPTIGPAVLSAPAHDAIQRVQRQERPATVVVKE